MSPAADTSAFGKWLERPPAPAYLLYGAGAGLAGLLATEWERRLRKEKVTFETFRWTTADLEREPPAIAWRSPSFFSRVRLYVLPDLAEAKKGQRDEIRAYLEQPEPSAILILHGSDFRQARTFSGSANLLSAAPREEQAVDALARYAVATAQDAGATLSREDAAFLARWTGCDFEALAVEIGKVLAFAADKGEVSEEDIRAVCAFRGEVNPFQLAEALVRSDRVTCLSLLRRFAAYAKDEDYHQLNGAVAWFLRDRLRGKGSPVSERRAAAIFDAVSRIDREMKGESRLSPAQIFEIRVLSVLT